MGRMTDLEAKQAITEALYRYCRSMDRIDTELGYGVWHPDGTALYSGIYEGSGRGFIDWVCEVHRGMEFTSHQVTNILIALDGDTATSEAYVTVRLRTSDTGSGRFNIMTTGRYLDRWSCRHGHWAIDHRQYLTDSSWTNPAPDPAAPGDPGDTEPTAGVPLLVPHPNRGDPSYSILGSVIGGG